MNKTVIVAVVVAICLAFMIPFIASAPQGTPDIQEYAPYSYDYKVEDAGKKLFFDKAESGDSTGKVAKDLKLKLCSRDK